MRVAAFALFIFGATVIAGAQSSSPSELARFGAGHTEGVAFDGEGNAYVSHGAAGVIWKIAPNGEKAVWARVPHPNGHKVLADGTHLVCDPNTDAVWHLGEDGVAIGKAATDCGGHALRRPNDLTLDDQGGFYFTDQSASSNAPIEELREGRICYVDSNMKSHVVVDGVWSPNGIVFRAASTSLLVAETRRNLIAEYPVLEPGRVGPRSVFAKLPDSDKWDFVGPDGIALDEGGNLYVAHYGTGQVRVLNTKGELIRSLPVGHEGVTNLAFGGPNRSELYVTGSVAAFAGDSPGVVNLLPLDDVRGLQLIPERP